MTRRPRPQLFAPFAPFARAGQRRPAAWTAVAVSLALLGGAGCDAEGRLHPPMATEPPTDASGPGSGSGPGPIAVRPDPDRDDDGLDDVVERRLGTDLAAEDTDGDGWLDGVEHLAGSDPRDPVSGPPDGSAQLVLRPGIPRRLRLPFTARLARGDVFFVLDATGSMAAVIDGVRGSLRDVIAPGLERVLERPALGVGLVRDFPRGPFGDPSDRPFTLGSSLPDGLDGVRAALDDVFAEGGGDVPEAHVEALGAAVDDPCPHPGGGRRGAACFSPDAFACVVLVTDAPTHNGPDGAHPYPFAARTWSGVTGALRRRGVRVLGVATSPAARPHLEALARATGAVAGDDGAPLVFDAGEDGAIGDAILDAVQALVAGVEVDVAIDLTRGDGPGDDRALRWLVGAEPAEATPAPSGRSLGRFEGLPGGAVGAFRLTFAAPAAATRDGRADIRPLLVRARSWPGGDVLARRMVWLVARPDPPPPLR